MRRGGTVQCLAGAGAAVLLLVGAAVPAGASSRAAPPPAAASSTASGLVVSVAYAENIGNSPAPAAAFPLPWAGSPNTVFLGSPNPMTSECGTATECYDAGAVRLDNNGATAVAVSNVTVDVHSALPGGKVYSLWGGFSVPAGESVILTENPPSTPSKYDNFDSSDTPHGQCTPVSVAPTVKITVAGVATTLVDSTHVIDTGGYDSGGCAPARNESIQWRQVGAAGTTNAALTLSPATATQFTGQAATETATLVDGSGFGLPNVPVSFSVSSGPDAGQAGSATTDSNGHASFTYMGAGQGEDVVVASATSVGPITSNAARLMWTDDSATGSASADIGTPLPPGTDAFDPATGTWTLNGAGTGLGGTSDQFHLVSQTPATGSGISARVASQTNTSPSAQAGLIARATTDPGSPVYAAVVTPGAGITVLDRATQGGTTTTLVTTSGAPPAYLWIATTGGSFTTYTSADGYFWQPLAGSAAAPALGSTPLVGLAASSNAVAQTSAASFDSIAVTASQPPPQPPVSCPAPWACEDIGGPTLAGSAVVSSGTWTVRGSGSDITNASDQFFYAAQGLNGDGSISAHVTAQTNTNPWAKAGVMLRAGTDPAAAEYSVLVTPSNGVLVESRASSGGGTSVVHATGAVPTYLEAVRTGSSFSAFSSSDGVTWTLIPGSTKTVTMAAAALEGLAVTAHTNSQLSTATMDTVVLNGSGPPPPPACPTGWSCADIGSPTPAGSESVSAGAWTIQGGGPDITGSADHFHFDWQSLAADGSVSAHVTAQSNSSSWAKAGVMLRAATDPGAADYALLVTPGNGIEVQYRGTQGGGTSRIATLTGKTVPAYLRVARSGNSFSAYTSADGSTWTLVPGSTVTISVSGAMLEGLAVSSHTGSALSTVTMDTVQPS